ncbi:MAG: hypothetical protein GWO02_04110, partial [Gammaproteobacteria bacterium]|nr:hypothetical protein [Gammaproteobacteria bacterium]
MKYVGWSLILCTSLLAGRPAGWDTHGAAEQAFDRLVLSPKVSDNIALLFGHFDTE